MVIALADPGRHLSGIRAAVAVAIEVTEREGVGHGPCERAAIQQRGRSLPDITPESEDSDDERQADQDREHTEHAGHDSVRHHAVEGAS